MGIVFYVGLVSVDSGVLHQLSLLAQDFLRKGNLADATSIVAAVIQGADEECFGRLDPVLDELISAYIYRAQLTEAELILRYCIAAPGAGGARMRRRLQLSEIYLATGRLQLSEDLFTEVLQISRLTNRPTEQLLRYRVKLLAVSGFRAEADVLRAQLPPSPMGRPKVFFALFGLDNTSLFGVDLQADL